MRAGRGGEERKENTGSYAQKHLSGGAKKPVVVRGLGRYLELRTMANVKNAQEEERKKQAFMVKKGSRPMKYPDGTTQVREFKLSGGREGLKEQLKREREEELRRACTFQPDTIEKRNRKIIVGLLGEDYGAGDESLD